MKLKKKEKEVEVGVGLAFIYLSLYLYVYVYIYLWERVQWPDASGAPYIAIATLLLTCTNMYELFSRFGKYNRITTTAQRVLNKFKSIDNVTHPPKTWNYERNGKNVISWLENSFVYIILTQMYYLSQRPEAKVSGNNFYF